ncbi:MAG: GNAT family N-acetyltransferase [Armatimonadetes bacterium]|nr:GNAT family N-acetyltransferase [Armatimonadota bacterium]
MAPAVIELPEDRIDEAVDCLVTAFVDDPVFDYFFPRDGADRLGKLRALFEFGCRYRFVTGQPTLALDLEGQIVGVANVRTPGPVESSDEIDSLWDRASAVFGEEATRRFDDYVQLKEAIVPKTPHHYLVSLAIKPGHQGMGLGGTLLEAVCDLAEDDPGSEATILDTCTNINVKFYEKHGFEAIGEGDVGGVRMVYLKRPCESQPG